MNEVSFSNHTTQICEISRGYMCRLYSDTSGMCSPLGVHSLLNHRDIATPMDLQERPIHKITLHHTQGIVHTFAHTCSNIIQHISSNLY